MSFAASCEQRAKVRHAVCIACGAEGVDPAHLIDRSLLPDHDGDPRRVVPLCRPCHRLYDTGLLDLLPLLERHHRQELGYAVQHFGLLNTLHRVSNERWAPLRRPDLADTLNPPLGGPAAQDLGEAA